MTRTITIDVTEEEENAASDAVQPYRAQVRDSADLTSILYDIDLLPEQIRLPVNAARMIAFCEVFKRLTPEQVGELFSSSDAQS